MECKELKKLFSQDESQILDFKQDLPLISNSQKDELTKDVSAFANLMGGIIVIGIEDKTRKIIGVTPGKIRAEQIQQVVNSRIAPPIEFSCQITRISGKQIITIEIPESTRKPHRMMKTDKVYIRRDSIIDVADDIEITEMQQSAEISRRVRALPREKVKKRLRLSKVKEWDHEDNRVFVFGESPKQYRKIGKSGQLSHVSTCPVFLPEFPWLPSPEFGRKSAAYVSSRVPQYHTLREFSRFLVGVEKKWQKLKYEYLLDAYGPFYWTLSDNGLMFYGCGASNLIEAMKAHKYGAVAAVLTGSFGEHYGRTCHLVVGTSWKSEVVKYTFMDLYLSSVPIDWNWVDHLYDSFRHMEPDATGPKGFTTIDLPCANWIPKQRLITPKILGGLRRFGYSRRKGGNDEFSGVIIAQDFLAGVDYHLDVQGSWHPEHFRDFRICPIYDLDELVVGLTNPPPYYEEIEAGNVKSITTPNVWATLFDGHGGSNIYGLQLHSSPRFE